MARSAFAQSRIAIAAGERSLTRIDDRGHFQDSGATATAKS
jgi:hypothetical protein